MECGVVLAGDRGPMAHMGKDVARSCGLSLTCMMRLRVLSSLGRLSAKEQ